MYLLFILFQFFKSFEIEKKVVAKEKQNMLLYVYTATGSMLKKLAAYDNAVMTLIASATPFP